MKKDYKSVKNGKYQNKQEPSKAEKPIIRKAANFEDIQKQLSAWVESMRIPGKIQAWFTAEAKPENSDWKIYSKLINGHESLFLDAPAKGMDAPEVVSLVFEQIKKEHLRNFRKAIRTIWFRACVFWNGLAPKSSAVTRYSASPLCPLIQPYTKAPASSLDAISARTLCLWETLVFACTCWIGPPASRMLG